MIEATWFYSQAINITFVLSMDMNKKIFFSYSRIDGSAFALRLAADLKNKGYDVWIDQEDIRAGKEWDIAIEQALVNCDYLLFLETEKSVASRNVLDEVYFALEQNKKVIPIIVVDSKTPFRLQRLQHVDFSKDYDKGLACLLLELQGESAGEAAAITGNPFIQTAGQSFYKKHRKLIWMITSLAIIAAALSFIFLGNKENDPAEVNTIHLIADSLTSDVVAGNWSLVDVEPKAHSHNGYLKIEAVDEKKIHIKSYVQFYYFPTHDTSQLEVFNGFTGCSSCMVAEEMKLTVEDIAIGSRTIITSNGEGGTKAGDTIKNASANKSISASASLRFIGGNNAEIKVQKRESTPLSNGLVLQPFTYIFRFKKSG